MTPFIEEVDVVGLGKRGGIVAVSDRKAKVIVKISDLGIDISPAPGEYRLKPKRTCTVHFLALAYEGKVIFVYPRLYKSTSLDPNDNSVTLNAVLRPQ